LPPLIGRGASRAITSTKPRGCWSGSMSEQTTVTYCPHCLKEVAHWLPVQPLYTLQDAMFYLMIPPKGAMYTALW